MSKFKDLTGQRFGKLIDEYKWDVEKSLAKSTTKESK